MCQIGCRGRRGGEVWGQTSGSLHPCHLSIHHSSSRCQLSHPGRKQSSFWQEVTQNKTNSIKIKLCPSFLWGCRRKEACESGSGVRSGLLWQTLSLMGASNLFLKLILTCPAAALDVSRCNTGFSRRPPWRDTCCICVFHVSSLLLPHIVSHWPLQRWSGGSVTQQPHPRKWILMEGKRLRLNCRPGIREPDTLHYRTPPGIHAANLYLSWKPTTTHCWLRLRTLSWNPTH